MSIPPSQYPEQFKENIFVNFLKNQTSATDRNFHYHNDHYELCYIIKGDVDYLFDYKEYKLYNFDLIFIDKKMPHKSIGNPDSQCERIIINFNDNFLSSIGTNSLMLSEIFATPHLKLPNKNVSEISQILTKLVFESDYPSAFSSNLIKGYMYELLVMLYRIAKKMNPMHTLPTNPIIEAATKYICQNYNQDISLDEIANYCHVSKHYLSRLFNSIMKVSFSSYLNSIRIHEATNMLIETNKTILDISQLCGFSSLKHFCEVFKKNKGITAREFRKMKDER